MEQKIEAIKKYETYFGFNPKVLKDDSFNLRKTRESASKCIQNARTSLLFWRLKDYKNDTERITNLFKRPIQQISPVGITTKWFSLDIRKNNNIDLIQNIDVYLEEIANEEGKDKDYYKDLFAYRAFPALFVYFTIGEFIDIAFQMIDTNIGNVKGVIGKMISTFFAGFPQISCAFAQNIIRGYKETSDITKAVEIAFMEMPITLSKYHMEIIKKLWTSNNPEAIAKLIYDEVLKPTTISLLINNPSFFFEVTKQADLERGFDDFRKKLMNNPKSILDKICKYDGANIKIATSGELGLDTVYHIISVSEVNLLLKLFSKANKTWPTLITEIDVKINDRCQFTEDSTFKFDVYFKFDQNITSDIFEDICDYDGDIEVAKLNSIAKNIIGGLRRKKIFYTDFFEDEQEWKVNTVSKLVRKMREIDREKEKKAENQNLVYIESIEGTLALEGIHGEIYEKIRERHKIVLNKIEDITVNDSRCKFTVDDTFGEITLKKNRKMLITNAIGEIETKIKVKDSVKDIKLQGNLLSNNFNIPKNTDLSERHINFDGKECEIEFDSELTAEFLSNSRKYFVVFPEIKGIAKFERCTKKNKTEEDVINTVIKDTYKARKRSCERYIKMEYCAKANDSFYETVDCCALNHMRIIGELIAKRFTLESGVEFFTAFDNFSKYIIPEIAPFVALALSSEIEKQQPKSLNSLKEKDIQREFIADLSKSQDTSVLKPPERIPNKIAQMLINKMQRCEATNNVGLAFIVVQNFITELMTLASFLKKDDESERHNIISVITYDLIGSNSVKTFLKLFFIYKKLIEDENIKKCLSLVIPNHEELFSYMDEVFSGFITRCGDVLRLNEDNSSCRIF